MIKNLKPLFYATLFAGIAVLAGCKKEPLSPQPPAETFVPVVTAIGQPVGSASTASIGAAGGSLTSPDGRVTLTIPAGALGAATSISIQPIENTAPLGVGLSYDFLPNGQQFAKPVTVTLHYTDEELAGTAPELLEFGFQNAKNNWQGKSNLQVNATDHSITATTKHFSRWSFYASFKLQPEQKTLAVNQTVNLQAMKLPYSEDPDPNNMEELLHTLGEPKPVAASDVSSWLVNGQASAENSANGWLTGTATNEKLYHAPAHQPAVNPVAVSAQIHTTRGNVTVVSNITVVEDRYFEFSCYGQSFKDLEGSISASATAGTLSIFMMAKDVTGDKIPSLVLAMGEGFKGVGSYSFGAKNQVACATTTWPYEWETMYFEKDNATPKFGSGTVTITSFGRIGEPITGTISGTLHFQRTVNDITEHLTAPVNAKFSAIRNE